MLACRRYLARQSEKFSHVYPLSVLPIVDYIIRKKIEVDNIRIIARGKESGLDTDQIKEAVGDLMDVAVLGNEEFVLGFRWVA